MHRYAQTFSAWCLVLSLLLGSCQPSAASAFHAAPQAPSLMASEALMPRSGFLSGASGLFERPRQWFVQLYETLFHGNRPVVVEKAPPLAATNASHKKSVSAVKPIQRTEFPLPNFLASIPKPAHGGPI